MEKKKKKRKHLAPSVCQLFDICEDARNCIFCTMVTVGGNWRKIYGCSAVEMSAS